jgi:hypothetical protein
MYNWIIYDCILCVCVITGMDNEHGFQNHQIVMNFDTWVEIMNLNQLKTIKCTFFHNFTRMQTTFEFKCNFNVHNDYKFAICKRL